MRAEPRVLSRTRGVALAALMAACAVAPAVRASAQERLLQPNGFVSRHDRAELAIPRLTFETTATAPPHAAPSGFGRAVRSPWAIPAFAVVGAGAGFGLGALSGLVVFGFSHAGADCMERGPCPWRLGDYVVTGGVVGSIVGLAAGATVGIVLVATAPAQPEVSLAPTPGGLQTKLRLHF